jgi:hypothetical protein
MGEWDDYWTPEGHWDAAHWERDGELRRSARWTEDGHDVAIELGQGDVAAIALGLSEKSTAAQRALAREVVRGWVGQAFGQLADQLGFQR